MRGLGKHRDYIGLMLQFFTCFRSRLGASVLTAMLAWSGAAHAQEYPCIHSMYAPEKEKFAQQARENIAPVVKALAASVRAKFTDAYLLKYSNTFTIHDLGAHNLEMIELEHGFSGNKKFKFRDLQADALWPAYHADFLATLATELGALDYRTITPTCSRRYSPDAFMSNAHITMFLLENGTVGVLKYDIRATADVEGRKVWKKNLERDLKGSGVTVADIEIGVTPTFPAMFTSSPQAITEDEIAKFTPRIAGFYGLSDEEMRIVYSRRIAWETERTLKYKACMLKYPLARDHPDSHLMAVCMGTLAAIGYYERRTLELEEGDRDTVLREFQQTTADLRATYGATRSLGQSLDYAKQLDSRDYFRRLDEADRRQERASTRAAILSGIAMGVGSAARSFEVDNQRAAAAADSRFRAQYGCTAGSCGRPHGAPSRHAGGRRSSANAGSDQATASGQDSAAVAANAGGDQAGEGGQAGGQQATLSSRTPAASASSAGGRAAAPTASRPMPPAYAPKVRPLRTATGTGKAMSAMHKGVIKPDSEICEQAKTNAQAGLGKKDFAFSGQCSCTDAGGYGLVPKRRECKIPYTYSEAIPDDNKDEAESMIR